MNLNVIVGNPPYNDGIDIDFAMQSFEYCMDYMTMITPAKWQTADSHQRVCQLHSYGDFRHKLVPHIAVVCFYPDCKDVFSIMQSDGITYYLVDKHKNFSECKVINKCQTVELFNSTCYRSILNRETLMNIGSEINEYLKDNKKFEFGQISIKHRYVVGTNSQLPGGGLYAITKSNPKVYYFGESKVFDTKNPDWNVQLSSQIKITFSQDSRDECESFASYMNSRFTRFFLMLNISKMTATTTDDYFRFVPAPMTLNAHGEMIPGKFDHIYTDEELFKTFKFPQKYIDIIKSLVKERKRVT